MKEVYEYWRETVWFSELLIWLKHSTPGSVVPLAKLIYVFDYSFYFFHFSSFSFAIKLPNLADKRPNPTDGKVGSPRDLGGRPLGTLYATTRGTITSRCYTCVYLSLSKYDCKNMILHKRISIGWLCHPQARLTMEEVKWSAFPFDGIPIPIDLFPKCHYINILEPCRYHVCLVVSYDRSSGKAHRSKSIVTFLPKKTRF